MAPLCPFCTETNGAAEEFEADGFIHRMPAISLASEISHLRRLRWARQCNDLRMESTGPHGWTCIVCGQPLPSPTANPFRCPKCL